jgi:hypothetical protein
MLATTSFKRAATSGARSISLALSVDTSGGPLGSRSSAVSGQQWRPLEGQILDDNPVRIRIRHRRPLHGQVVATTVVPVRGPLSSHANAICSDLRVRVFILGFEDIQVAFGIDAQATPSYATLAHTDGSSTTRRDPNASRLDDTVDATTVSSYPSANPVMAADASGTPTAPAATSRHARIEDEELLEERNGERRSVGMELNHDANLYSGSGLRMDGERIKMPKRGGELGFSKN